VAGFPTSKASSAARRSDLGEADAWLIAISELDAGAATRYGFFSGRLRLGGFARLGFFSARWRGYRQGAIRNPLVATITIALVAPARVNADKSPADRRPKWILTERCDRDNVKI